MFIKATAALYGFGDRETLVVIGHDVDLGTNRLAHGAYHGYVGGEVGITQADLAGAESGS